ncbi:hypothetical protein RD110_07955 [Rhodoferax koreense]|uniref:Uncharacterized protein n=1 Tax=Rhodoferax koreensis TaxID=1842727 RepID=A0A1P8JTP7_9BURK|nr:hypothetical protein [Rhodoferax koreense]APW37137.1 hypothetical protein RD110_07955 [Rhodoferax koreense]
MSTARATRITDIEVFNLPGDNEVAMTVETGETCQTVVLDNAEAAALITSLTARLMERQTPEAMQLLQIFAIRKIDAGQTPDGRPYLQYQLENGLTFGTGITRGEVAALHASLGALLVN